MNIISLLIRTPVKIYSQRNFRWVFKFCSTLSAVYCINEKDNLKKIEFQDPQKLTHGYLIKQASTIAVNSASQLLTQTVVATLDIGEQYKKALYDLLSLIEESRNTLNSSMDQQEFSDMMIEARARVNDLKKQLMDMDSLLEYVEKVAVSTAEASFLAGAEYVSSTLSERLYSALEQVKEVKRVIAELEAECLEMQKKFIIETGENERRKSRKNG